MITYVGLLGHSAVVFHVFMFFMFFCVLLTLCVVVFFQWHFIDLSSCIAACVFNKLTYLLGSIAVCVRENQRNILPAKPRQLSVHGLVAAGVVRALDSRLAGGRGFDSRLFCFQIAGLILGNMLQAWLLFFCHRAVEFGTAQRAVMPYGNRRSGVALALRLKVKWFKAQGREMNTPSTWLEEVRCTVSYLIVSSRLGHPSAWHGCNSES